MKDLIFTTDGWENELLTQIKVAAINLGIEINNTEVKALIDVGFKKHYEDEAARSYHSLSYHIVPMIQSLVGRKTGPFAKAIKSFMGAVSMTHIKGDPINYVSSGFNAECNPQLNWELMFWALLFHDVILDPRKTGGENERDSAAFWKENATKLYPSFGFVNIEMVSQMILATYGHEHHDLLIQEFLKIDLSGFTQSFDKILKDELEVRKEYGWLDWNDYKQGRIKFLKAYADNQTIKSMGVSDVLLQQAAYMEFLQPRIVIFPGSFKHWHLGHQNVVEQLEKMFDKVIIVFATNPEKNDVTKHIPEILKNRQVEFVEGSLMKWVESLPYPVTIARGIRDGKDLDYEKNYVKWLKEFATKPINIMAVFSEPTLEHISSTNLRVVEKIEPEKLKQYIHE